MGSRGNARLASKFRWLRVLYIKSDPTFKSGRTLVGLSAARSVLGVVMILRPELPRVLLLTFAASGAGLPQTAPLEPAPQPPVVLRATSRQVRVNVIVRDRHGEPVRDLKKENFRVYDNGKLQQISAFSMDSNALLPSAPALPPNTFTNWSEQKVPASVTVILLDALNSHIEDRQWVKKQVIHFLSTIRTEDSVGVYALGHGLHVLHDFTTDSSLLLKQLARHNGSQLPEWAVGKGSSFNPDTDPAAVAFDAWLSGTGVSRDESEFYSVNPATG